MTHTPGPWRAEPCTNGFRAPDAGDFQIVAENMICPGTVWGQSGFKEGEANARLIAAAPELLEMVWLLERTLVYEIRKSDKEGDDEGAKLKFLTLAQVREVIAKATAAD